MTFTPKFWQNKPSTATPVDAAGLIDMEARLAAYADSYVVTGGNLGPTYTLDTQSRNDVLFTGTLGANTILTLANLVAGTTVTIIITQDPTGARTLTVNGVAVAVSSTPASLTVLKVYSPDGSSIVVAAPSIDPPIHGACAKRAAAQSIANNSTVLVSFDTEVYDTDGYINLGTSATRIVIPPGLGGLYAISAEWAWAINQTGLRFGTVFKNSTLPTIGGDLVPAKDETDGNLYHEEPLAAGDYLELIVKQTSGGALNATFDGLGGNMPRLAVRRLGPTP